MRNKGKKKSETPVFSAQDFKYSKDTLTLVSDKKTLKINPKAPLPSRFIIKNDQTGNSFEVCHVMHNFGENCFKPIDGAARIGKKMYPFTVLVYSSPVYLMTVISRGPNLFKVQGKKKSVEFDMRGLWKVVSDSLSYKLRGLERDRKLRIRTSKRFFLTRDEIDEIYSFSSFHKRQVFKVNPNTHDSHFVLIDNGVQYSFGHYHCKSYGFVWDELYKRVCCAHGKEEPITVEFLLSEIQQIKVFSEMREYQIDEQHLTILQDRFKKYYKPEKDL